MVEHAAQQLSDLSRQKQADLDQNSRVAQVQFTYARDQVSRNQPTLERVERVLESGQQQLRTDAAAQTLSRQEAYTPFNQAGEKHTNIWWRAQFSMAEAALRTDTPTAIQREALQNVLNMVVRLTEAEANQTVSEFENSLLTQFGMRFLSELTTVQPETGEEHKRSTIIFRKIRSVFTSFRYAIERTQLDLDQLRQQRARLVNNAQYMLALVHEKLPVSQ